MNTGFRGVLPMYDIFGCASDFAHNFRHLMPTTLNCGATPDARVNVYRYLTNNDILNFLSQKNN